MNEALEAEVKAKVADLPRPPRTHVTLFEYGDLMFGIKEHDEGNPTLYSLYVSSGDVQVRQFCTRAHLESLRDECNNVLAEKQADALEALLK